MVSDAWNNVLATLKIWQLSEQTLLKEILNKLKLFPHKLDLYCHSPDKTVRYSEDKDNCRCVMSVKGWSHYTFCSINFNTYQCEGGDRNLCEFHCILEYNFSELCPANSYIAWRSVTNRRAAWPLSWIKEHRFKCVWLESCSKVDYIFLSFGCIIIFKNTLEVCIMEGWWDQKFLKEQVKSHWLQSSHVNEDKRFHIKTIGPIRLP